MIKNILRRIVVCIASYLNLRITKDKDCLGYIVLYGSSGGKLVSYTSVNKAMQKSPLAEYSPNMISKKLAIARAVNDILSEDRNLMAQTVKNPSKIITNIYIKQNNIDNKNIVFEPRTIISYYIVSKLVVAKGPDRVEFKRLYNKYLISLTGSDLRQLSRKIVEGLSSISLRGGQFVHDAGGVYFIPSERIEILLSLRKFLKKFRIGYVKTLIVIDGGAERKNIFDAAMIYYKRQIQSCIKKAIPIKRWSNTLDVRLNELEKIWIDIDKYAEITWRENHKKLKKLKNITNNFVKEVEKYRPKVDQN